jgi:hypothetical protein
VEDAVLAITLFGLTFSGRELAVIAIIVVIVVVGAWFLMRRR